MKKRKMIHVSVAFWTNDIKQKSISGALAHESGAVYIRKDEVNGVKTKGPHFFNKRSDIDHAISEALEEAGVHLLENKLKPKYA